MINSILSKVLEELNKESPKLDYIRGMVEVLLAMQKPETQSITPNVGFTFPPYPTTHVATYPDLPPVSNIKEIQELAKLG